MENNHSDNEQYNQFPCPFCETLNNANAKFCRKCGKNISAFSNKVEQELNGGNARQQIINKCSNCGAINRPEAMFCKECGNKLIPVVMQKQSQPSTAQLEKPVQQTTVMPVTPVQPASMPVEEEQEPVKVNDQAVQETVTPVQPAPVPSEKEQEPVKVNEQTAQEFVNRCPSCGAINDQDAAFCKGCGQKLERLATEMPQQASATIVTKPLPTPAPVTQTPLEPAQMKEPEIIKEPEKIEPVKPAQETMTQAAIKYCPSCGASNKSDAGFCKECGQKLAISNTEAPVPQIQSELAQVQQQNYINTNPSPAVSEPVLQTIKQQPVNEEKKKSFSLKKILIPLLCLILLLAGAGGFYLYKNGKFNMPGKDNPVKNYVEALNKNNYTAAYQMLNVKESAFVNAGQFEIFVKSQTSKTESVYSKLQGKLEKISTEKKRETQNSDVYEVKATADGQPFSFMVEMDKQTKKINLAENEFAPVELEAPPGTELKIDGVKVENGFKLDGLFAGKHSVEAQNPFLELGYYNNFNFEPEKQTKVKLVHTAWLKANQIGAVDNASLSFINAFLKATITNESLKHETLKYKDDDSITNMYQKINTYMLKNGITEMVMTEGKTTNPVYAADGKIHSQYDFSGTYKKGQDGRTMNANGSIQLQLDIEGNDLIVSKVDSYNLHVKK
ncbi:MAG: zinc ribbon domain-containing protein [Acidaminococcaceae bacterium]|nr:zinc ribbon domain-containing protein [Acidaminococcaceae bacterium]